MSSSGGRNLAFGAQGNTGLFGSSPVSQPWTTDSSGLFGCSSTGLFGSSTGNSGLFAAPFSGTDFGAGVGVGQIGSGGGASGTSPTMRHFGSGLSSGVASPAAATAAREDLSFEQFLRQREERLA